MPCIGKIGQQQELLGTVDGSKLLWRAVRQDIMKIDISSRYVEGHMKKQFSLLCYFRKILEVM